MRKIFNKNNKIFTETNFLNFDKEKDDLERRSQLINNDELMDKVKELKEHINREKERFNSQLDQLNALKEDFEILTKKHEILETEKEKIEIEKNTLSFKLQGFSDQVQEKDEIIQLQEIKIESKAEEVDHFKKQVTKLMATLKNYEKNNEKGEKDSLEEAKIVENNEKTDKIISKLQKENLIIQHKLKLKDEILEQIKKSKNYSEETENLIQLNNRMLEEIEEKESKKESKIKVALLNNYNLAEIESSNNDSFYLSESEVEQLVVNQKMIHARIEEELAQKRKMRQEIENLKNENPDVEEISKAIVEEKMQEMK